MTTAPGPSSGRGDSDGDGDDLAELLHRFTLDSGSRRQSKHAAAQVNDEQSPAEPETDISAEPWPEHDVAEDTAHSGDGSGEELATAIRPYAWTGGRTRSNHQLELETLVSTSAAPPVNRASRLEHHSVAELCSQPRSVAEIGALLGVPIGVTKVLLGDMADLGLVSVHETVVDSGSASHLDLMERVLSGLRKL